MAENLEFLSIEHALEILDHPKKVGDDKDEEVLDDHRHNHTWATTKPERFVEGLKSRKLTFEQGLRRLHEIYSVELRKRHYDHDSPLTFEAPILVKLQDGLKAFRWRIGGVQWVGSAVKGKTDPRDLDVVIRLNEFDEPFLDQFKAMLPEEQREGIEGIWDSRGAHGPFINAGDFWFQPSEEMKIQVPKYKIAPLEPILPLFPGETVKFENIEKFPDNGWIVEVKPAIIRLLVHRRFDKIKAFDKEAGEFDLPENLEKAFLNIEDPLSFIVDGYYLEDDEKFLISDMLWWRETELIELPAQNRRAFVAKFPDANLISKNRSQWCLDGEEISHYLRSLHAGPDDEFIIKSSSSIYNLNGVTKEWYLLRGLQKVLKAAAPSDEKIKDMVDSSRWEKTKAGERTNLMKQRSRIEPLYPYLPIKTSKKGYQIREVFGIKPIKALARQWFKAPNKVAVEVKFDAYRIQIHKEGDQVRVFTESGREISKVLPNLVADVKKLKASSCVLDSEQVPYDESGVALGRRAAAQAFGGKDPVDDKNWVAHVFDLLYLNGKDLHTEPYEQRRKLLRGIELRVLDVPTKFPLSMHLNENSLDWATSAEMMIKLAQQKSQVRFSEGAMFKQAISKHPLAGTTPLWAKMKATFEIDAIVLGRKPKMHKSGKMAGKPIAGQWTYVGGCGPIAKPDEANPTIKGAPVNSAKEARYIRLKGKLYSVLGDSFGSAEDMKPGDIMRVGVRRITKFSPTRYHWLIPKVLEHRKEKASPDPLSVAAEIARESYEPIKTRKAAFPFDSRMGAGSVISSMDPRKFLGVYVDGGWYYAIIKTPKGIKDFMEKHGAEAYYARDISWSLHEYLTEQGLPVELTSAETARDALDLWTYIDEEIPFMKGQFTQGELRRFYNANPDTLKYPYTMSNPPERIKKLPKGAQRIWISTFNNNFRKWGEKRASKIAWHAVKQGYHKVGDKWVRKASAYGPAFNQCMNCPKPPTIEVMWAEGRAHAWFCDACFEKWEKENKGAICDRAKIRDGVASKGWTKGRKRDRRKFQASQYMVNPDETKEWKYIVHAHVRGLSVHIEPRFEIAKGEKLIGWTMDALKSLIKPMIARYVSDSQLAQFGLTKAKVKGMTIREVSDKLRSTLPGRKFYAAMSKKSETLDDSTVKSMVQELIRTELTPILTEPEKKILLQIKAPEPYEWLTTEGRVKPGEVGATKEHSGRFFIIDKGTVEFGAQKSYFHEYWLRGSLFKNKHLVIRRLPTQQKWRLKSPFAWMGFFTKPEKLPYTITKRAIDTKFMPPAGRSALPKAIRNQIPVELQYWNKKEPGETRAALVQAIKKRQVKLRFAAGLRFAVKRLWYKGQLVVRGAPTVFYYLIFHDGDKVVKAWDFGREDPLEVKTVSTRLGKSKDPKLIRKTVDLSSSHILNPTEKLTLHVDTVDEGSLSLIADSKNFLRFKLNGGKFNGLYVLVRQEPGSAEWFFKKAELPQPTKKQMFGSYAGTISIPTPGIEVKQLEDLLLVSGPFLRPGEMIGIDMRPTFFPPEAVPIITNTMPGVPVVAMHGDLKGDVVGFVRKVSVRQMPNPQTGKMESVGYCDQAIVWHPKAIELISSQALPDFSIELMPKSVWDAEKQREVVLGGIGVGLGIVTQGAGKGLHIDKATLVRPTMGEVKKDYKLRKKFGVPLAEYLTRRYWQQEASFPVLATELGVSRTAVKNMFSSLGIETRSWSEAAEVRRSRERTVKKFGGAVSLTFLGTSAEKLVPFEDCVDPQCSEARKGGPSRRNHSALLLTYGGNTLVLDAPENIVEMLALQKIRPQHILVTHSHLDHAAGLKHLASPELNIYSTKEGWASIPSAKEMPFKKRVITPGKPFRISGFIITPFKVAHSTIAPTTAYRIKIGERTLFYAPDVLEIPDKAQALENVDIYIGDGSSISRPVQDDKGKHASMKKQIEWCTKAEIPEILFTHIGHVKLSFKDLNEKLKKLAPNAVAMYDGASFMLTDENPGHRLPQDHAKMLWEGKKRMIVSAKPHMRYATKVIFFVDEEKAWGRMVEGFPEGPFDADEVRKKLRRFHQISDAQWKEWFKGQKQVYIFRPRIISKFDEALPYRTEKGQQVYIRNVKILPMRR